VLCEGFLGIEPHFELWRYFIVSLVKKADGSTALIGSALWTWGSWTRRRRGSPRS
jgi:hypothetical protein